MLQWLNRPLGPFPLWIWLVVIGGGLLVAFVIVPKLRGSSGTSLGSGNTSSNAPALDQSLYDPTTGIPLQVETTPNPVTGLPNYNNLVGLQGTTAGIAGSQSNPSGPGGLDQTSAAAIAYAQQQAVAAWENKNHTTWPYGPGTYPAGWTTIPGLPGAK